VLAARIIAGNPSIISTILSVPIFVLVLLLTSLMASLRLLTLLQLLLLLSFLSLSIAEGPWNDADAPFAIIAGMLGVAAMATQNAMVQVGLINTPTTAVMTTNVTHLMVDISVVLLSHDATEVATAKSRALRTLTVVVGFILGCAVGAAAALAGITAAIITSDQLGATGGVNGEAFTFAIFRASEISIGIVFAGLVLAATDLGGAPRRVAALMANLTAEISHRFIDTLAAAGPDFPDTQATRREFTGRVIAIDPIIDQSLGNHRACATTPRYCKARWMDCSLPWSAG
jgi:uncharacterized membrane protein YoaK (UPF0700 family)